MPSFEFGFNAPWIAAVAAVPLAFLLAILWYRRTLPPASAAVRAVLTLLRGTSLSLILLLFFEPVIRAVLVSGRPPQLAVLIDASASMRLRDAAGARDSILQETLTRLPGVLPPGTGLVVRTFASAAGAAETTLPDTVRPDGPSTNIDRALRAAGEDASRVQAVLLLSDGNATAGPNPLYAAEELRLPVYTIGIGDSAEQRDLLITAVSANRVMLAGTPTPVEVRVKSAGFDRERVMVTLSDGRRELARADLSLRPGVSEYAVPLTFTPRGEGTQFITARVSTLAGELTADNNRRVFSSVVLKERLRIVIVSGAPGADQAVLRHTLQEDPNVTVRSFTQRPGGGFFEGELREVVLDSADCLVLLGYPGPQEREESVRRIAAVTLRQRTPLLFVTGRALDHRLLGPLSSLLPFTTGEIRTPEQSVFAVPVEGQRDHPLLSADSAAGLSAWDALPPIFRTSTTYQTKPGSTVLATARLQSVRLPDPLLVVRSSGGQRVLAVLGYGLWRWRLMAQGNPAIASFYGAFFGTAVRWLTTRDDLRPVRIGPLQTAANPLEPLEFEAQVRDGAARPVENATVTVTLSGKEYTGGITLSAAAGGRYGGSFAPVPVGEYVYRGRAVSGETLIGADSGRVVVGSVDLESYETRMAVESLRLLASRTGGAFFLPAELEVFGRVLRSQPSFVPGEQRTATTVEFRHWPYALALMVLLLAAEWLIRKRRGML